MRGQKGNLRWFRTEVEENQISMERYSEQEVASFRTQRAYSQTETKPFQGEETRVSALKQQKRLQLFSKSSMMTKMMWRSWMTFLFLNKRISFLNKFLYKGIPCCVSHNFEDGISGGVRRKVYQLVSQRWIVKRRLQFASQRHMLLLKKMQLKMKATILVEIRRTSYLYANICCKTTGIYHFNLCGSTCGLDCKRWHCIKELWICVALSAL